MRIVVFSETAYVLAGGIVVGGLSAFLAVLPQLASPASQVSVVALGLSLGGILVVGMIVTALSLRAALRVPLLPALRRE